MLNLRLLMSCLVFSLFASWQMKAQPIYYNTSSSTLSLNTLDSVATSGSGNTLLLTATGVDFNKLNRCTAVAVDGLHGKLFLVDGAANALWSVNLNGSGLTLVTKGLTNYPTDLALDVVNQEIYYTTSSTLQNNNTVQRIDYTGNNNTILFTASGGGSGVPGNGVSRCTAIAVDTLHSKIFIADAGAKQIWSMSLTGTGLASLIPAASSIPTGLALDVTNQQVYFTLGSPVQGGNLIQQVNYSGSGLTTLFTASGSVQRCTALDLDVAHAAIYLSDAGADALWRIPIGSSSATMVLSGLTATIKKVRLFNETGTPVSPGFIGIKLSGTNVTFSAANGFGGGTYYVLMSTNVALPLGQWLPVSTNILGMGGISNITATNVVISNALHQFYILRIQ